MTHSCADGHPLPAGCQSTGRSQHYYMSEVISPALQQEPKHLQQQQQHNLSIAEYAHVYFSDEWNASPYDGEASPSAYPRNLFNMPQYSDLQSNRIAFLSLSNLPPPPSFPPSTSLSPDESVNFEQKLCQGDDSVHLLSQSTTTGQGQPLCSRCNGASTTACQFQQWCKKKHWTDLPCNDVCALV